MISFDTVPILEPDLKTSFTSICNVTAYITLIFLQCWLYVMYKMFRCCARKNLHTTLDLIYFLFKRCILIPFGIPSLEITPFLFCVKSLSLCKLSPRTVNKDSSCWLILENCFWFSIYCDWCFAFSCSLLSVSFWLLRREFCWYGGSCRIDTCCAAGSWYCSWCFWW